MVMEMLAFRTSEYQKTDQELEHLCKGKGNCEQKSISRIGQYKTNELPQPIHAFLNFTFNFLIIVENQCYFILVSGVQHRGQTFT